MLKKPNLTPEKAKAVAYFKQFPSNFLKSYGRAAEPPTQETINKRTHSISCEWFLCPKVAMSEFAATMVENLSVLKDHKSPLVKTSKFSQLVESSEAFLHALNSLNTKTEANPTIDDVKKVMHYIYDESNAMEGIVDDMFVLGGAMFATAIHYIVTHNVLSDPQAYATKLESDYRATKKFKTQANVKGLKAFLGEQCLSNPGEPSTSSPSTGSRKRLLEELDQSDKPPKK